MQGIPVSFIYVICIYLRILVSNTIFMPDHVRAVTCGAGTVNPSGAPACTLGFWWCSCCSIFSFLHSVLQIIVYQFVNFILAIALSVLRYFQTFLGDAMNSFGHLCVMYIIIDNRYVSFGHCIFSSLIYSFLLPLLCLQPFFVKVHLIC